MLIRGSEDCVDFCTRAPCFTYIFFLFSQRVFTLFYFISDTASILWRLFRCCQKVLHCHLLCWKADSVPVILISNAQGQENMGWGRKFAYIIFSYIMVLCMMFPPLTLRLMVQMRLWGPCSVLRPPSCTFPRACVTPCEAVCAPTVLLSL